MYGYTFFEVKYTRRKILYFAGTNCNSLMCAGENVNFDVDRVLLCREVFSPSQFVTFNLTFMPWVLFWRNN